MRRERREGIRGRKGKESDNETRYGRRVDEERK